MSILLLSLAYLLPLVLLALLIASGRTVHWRRAALVVLVLLPVFYIGHYLGLQAIQGWPSSAPLPDEFQLLAFEVTEPDRKTENPGEILLWLRAETGQAPRVQRLDYDEALHASLLQAGERQSAGTPQQGRVERAGPASAAGQARGEQVRFEDRPLLRPPPKDDAR